MPIYLGNNIWCSVSYICNGGWYSIFLLSILFFLMPNFSTSADVNSWWQLIGPRRKRMFFSHQIFVSDMLHPTGNLKSSPVLSFPVTFCLANSLPLPGLYSLICPSSPWVWHMSRTLLPCPAHVLNITLTPVHYQGCSPHWQTRSTWETFM